MKQKYIKYYNKYGMYVLMYNVHVCYESCMDTE